MKKFINTLLIFCMCFGALCISYGAQEYGTEDTSIKDNNNSYEKIEILDSVPNNFGFEIEKDKYLTDKNIDSYVSVKDVVGDSVSLTVEDAGDSYYILPKEPNYSYKINKIEKPNHTYYNGNLTQYATIENNYLTTTDEIEIGSRIFITAVATEDDVESSTLVVTVNRIEIERIQFKDDFYRNDINLGEKLGIELSVFPTNATFNILNDETVDVYISKNKECATINKIDDFHYELYAFDNNENIGKIITVTVAIGDYLRTFSYTIGAIPIESMTLYNAETQTELDSTISLTRGGILKVSAVINPVNASLKEVSYNIFADIPNYGRYVSIDSNGTLKISDNAPFGMEIFLSATAMHKSTGSYKIVVEQIPVESVMLTSEYSYIEKNAIISLEAYVYPEKADIESTTYKIVNEAPGVFISGNRLFASNNAVADSYVEVVAVVNGVQSNKLVIYIVEDISDTVLPSDDETPATDEFEYITSDNRQVVGKNSEQGAND